MKTKPNNFLSKTVAILTVICLMLGMIPLTAVDVSAAAPTSYTTITTNSTASVSITSAGSAKYFKFVPTQSGTYKFYSTNYSADPKASLLDASGSTLTTNDDNGTDYNFSITYDCVANTTYYIKAYLFSSSSTGSYTLNVQTMSTTGTTPTSPTGSVVDITTSGAYSLFNSGRSGSGYNMNNSNKSLNYDAATYTNGGYDIYARGDFSSSTLGTSHSGCVQQTQIGLSFFVEKAITEQVFLNVNAYDVDESDGERDYIYLVDETDGTSVSVGILSGMDNQWNNTSFAISPSEFEVGHTYHFEVKVTSTRTGPTWWVYIRTVSMSVSDVDDPDVVDPVDPIEAANITANINNFGQVSVTLTIDSRNDNNYSIEFKATHIDTNNQLGSLFATMDVAASGSTQDFTFSLESGFPTGAYRIDAYMKDATTGDVLRAVSCQAGIEYSVVTYQANGGTSNLPTDTTAYTNGDTVTVLFDYIPSRTGYNFLGWATSSTATTPDYTESGTKTFTIGSSDVTLYAVWALDVCNHVWEEASRTEPTCTEYGEVVYTCTCGEGYSELLEPTGHDYQIMSAVQATCTTDGYIEFACMNDGCSATKRQVLTMLGHDFVDDNVCDHCGYTIEIHTHVYEEDVVAPTCTTMGYTEYTCSCGHSYRDDYVEPSRHNWDSGAVTIEKTCTSDGLLTYACRDCSAEKTELLIAGHVWSETVTVEKTCTTDGSKMKTCTACGTVETEVIPAGHNWDEGTETLAATCTAEGSKTCTCLDCGATEAFAIPALGHHFVDGVCIRCGIGFIDVVTPSTHPLYGMYFEIDDILSDYGPSLIDEYGLMLDYNSGANLEKVAVYLTQDGTMWRRCIAVKGTNITYATYVPYLSYQSEIKYTGLNHDWINIFRLSENADDIWCHNNYTTIGVNLEDAYGNLLLSLYDIGQAGAETRIFDDLDEMIAWLNDTCVEHTPSDWIIDRPAASTHTGLKHKECTVCGETLESTTIPALAKIEVAKVEAEAGSTVRVTIDIQNNPGVKLAFLTIDYDPALTLIGAEAGGAWSSLAFEKDGEYSTPYDLVWDGDNADYRNGTFVVLTFEVPEGVDPGTVYDIDVLYNSEYVLDGYLNPIALEIENGCITVENNIGDVNYDGIVDITDLVALRRHIVGGYGVTIDEVAADLNGNGSVDPVDIIFLRSLLAG